MNRKILFKAKRKDNGEWVTGNVLQSDEDTYIATSFLAGNADEPLMVAAYEIVPETLCQYTGLTDKNGKKIWENDILKAHLDENYPEDITYTKIIWSECRFCTKENNSSDIETLEKWEAEYFETCGNIFDNPELLEVV